MGFLKKTALQDPLIIKVSETIIASVYADPLVGDIESYRNRFGEQTAKVLGLEDGPFRMVKLPNQKRRKRSWSGTMDDHVIWL